MTSDVMYPFLTYVMMDYRRVASSPFAMPDSLSEGKANPPALLLRLLSRARVY